MILSRRDEAKLEVYNYVFNRLQSINNGLTDDEDLSIGIDDEDHARDTKLMTIVEAYNQSRNVYEDEYAETRAQTAVNRIWDRIDDLGVYTEDDDDDAIRDKINAFSSIRSDSYSLSTYASYKNNLSGKLDMVKKIVLHNEEEIDGMTQETIELRKALEEKADALIAANLVNNTVSVASGVSNNNSSNTTNTSNNKIMIDGIAKLINGELTADKAMGTRNVIDSIARIITGKDTPEQAQAENNLADATSKIITGVKVDDLTLDDDRGYNSTLLGRMKKITELYTGIQTGLYNEEEVEDKLTNMDIDELSSIEEQLGDIEDVPASFMLNKIRRESNFIECFLDPENNIVNSSTGYDDDAGYYYSGTSVGSRRRQSTPPAQTVCSAPVSGRTHHRDTNPGIEIERAIKALVLSFVHGDLKGDIRMAELRKEDYPTNIPKDLWDDLKHAYGKIAGDFATQINKFDPSQADNHPYHNPCTQTTSQHNSNTPCTPRNGYERDGKLNITDRQDEKN